jgi:transcription-repair coupling factor (superfamily II helicase)
MDSAKRSVVQDYRTSAEMASFRSALEEASPRLGGLWGASSAFLLAAWKDEKAAGKGCCLVVTATQEEADELVEELGVFSTLPVAAFPAWEALFLEDAVPDDDIYRQRLEVCARLAASAASEAFFVVAPIQALLQPVPAPEMLRASLLTIESGVEQSPHALATRFVEAGFRDVPLVEARGEFSLRGDILDVFPYQGEAPLRLEYFGDTLESLREFRAENQRSIAASEKQRVDILLPPRGAFFRDCFRQQTDLLLTDLIGDGSRVFLKEAEAIAERAEKIFSNLVGEDAARVLEQFRQRFDAIAAVEISTFPVETADRGINLRILSVESYRAADLDDFCKLLGAKLDAGFKVEVYCENAAEAKRFGEILADYKLHGREGLLTRVGPLRRGLELESQRTVWSSSAATTSSTWRMASVAIWVWSASRKMAWSRSSSFLSFAIRCDSSCQSRRRTWCRNLSGPVIGRPRSTNLAGRAGPRRRSESRARCSILHAI